MTGSATIASGVRRQGRVQAYVERLKTGDEVARLIALTAACAVGVLTVLLVWNLWTVSAPTRMKFGLSFLWTTIWDSNTDQYGALPYIYGTTVTSLVALLIAVPLGVGAAIFLAELAPIGLSDALTFLIELLAAVPSVIFGLIGIFVLVPVLESSVVPALKAVFGFLPFFQGPFYGVSIFTASIVLSLMIVPFIIFGVARNAFGGAQRFAGSGACTGVDQMGIDVAGGGALRP
jgi:phosphate transport system permease protein